MKYDIDIDSYIGYPISKGYIKAKIAPIKGRPITVRINSYGGDVQTALDIRQQFIDHGDVSAYIFGMTASAATMLAMGAKKIYMSRYALMLIHCSSTLVAEWAGMNAEDLKRHISDHSKTLEDLKTIDDVIASLYCRRNGRTLDEMKAIMKEEKWLTAERCKELGLIDEIIEEGKQLPAATAAVRERFAACGLPVPDELSAAADRSILARIRRLVSADTAAEEPEPTAALAPKPKPQPAPADLHTDQDNPFQIMNNNYSHLMEAVGVEQLEADEEGRIVLTAAQLQAVEARMQELNDETERLQTENDRLSAEDGADTGHIEDRSEDNSDSQSFTSARQTYDLIRSLI